MEGDCNVYAHSSLWMRPTGEWSINAKMVYKIPFLFLHVLLTRTIQINFTQMYILRARVIASLSLLGGQRKNITSISPHLPVFCLFSSIFHHFPPHLGLLGERFARLGRPWPRHCSEQKKQTKQNKNKKQSKTKQNINKSKIKSYTFFFYAMNRKTNQHYFNLKTILLCIMWLFVNSGICFQINETKS